MKLLNFRWNPKYFPELQIEKFEGWKLFLMFDYAWVG